MGGYYIGHIERTRTGLIVLRARYPKGGPGKWLLWNPEGVICPVDRFGRKGSCFCYRGAELVYYFPHHGPDYYVLWDGSDVLVLDIFM